MAVLCCTAKLLLQWVVMARPQMPNFSPAAASIPAYAQTLGGGGVERVLPRLAREWGDLGRHVTLVIGEASGPLAAELPANVDVRILGDPSYGGLRAVAGIAGTLVPDLIFCPGNHYTGMALHLRVRLGRRRPPIVAKVSNRLERADQGDAGRDRLSRLAAAPSALHRSGRRDDPGDARRGDPGDADRARPGQRHLPIRRRRDCPPNPHPGCRPGLSCLAWVGSRRRNAGTG